MLRRNSQPNRSRRLYFRVLLRSLSVKRPQAVLAMVSLAIGAAIVSMILNLSSDVRRKMTQEFRAYGPNVLLAPELEGRGLGGLMDEAVLARLEPFRSRRGKTRAVGLLYTVVRLGRARAERGVPESLLAIAAGADFAELRTLFPSWQIEGGASDLGSGRCAVGSKVASQLHLKVGDSLGIEPEGAGSSVPTTPGRPFQVAAVVTTGASEDEQVFLSLQALQNLADLEGKISLVELSVPGEPEEVNRALGELTQAFPHLDVRPVREIVYSEGKVLGTLRWLMVSLTGLILATVALGVAATMTSIVLERRRDIAVMKALGASNASVTRLFLAEGVALGLAGGVAGSALGGFLASQMARRLFGTGLDWVAWVFPAVCLFSMLLAGVATAFPVEIIRAIQPATTLKGE